MAVLQAIMPNNPRIIIEALMNNHALQCINMHPLGEYFNTL
jgi:hypothetical protein